MEIEILNKIFERFWNFKFIKNANESYSFVGYSDELQMGHEIMIFHIHGLDNCINHAFQKLDELKEKYPNKKVS